MEVRRSNRLQVKPQTLTPLSEGENIKIYLVQFSAQESLGAAAQIWRLERIKLALSCFQLFFFQRYIPFSPICFGFDRIYGTIRIEELLIQSFTVFIFQFLALTCIFVRKCLLLVHFCGDVLG